MCCKGEDYGSVRDYAILEEHIYGCMWSVEDVWEESTIASRLYTQASKKTTSYRVVITASNLQK